MLNFLKKDLKLDEMGLIDTIRGIGDSIPRFLIFFNFIYYLYFPFLPQKFAQLN